ncbi:MAG: hypothetical protein OEW18_03115 [Candidatus Aminicenantes bacterium]|nr:hypothetical protein [Candidatus Aminicenantes bacterium]
MSMKKALALVGWLLVLGSGLVMAQGQKQAGHANMVQSRNRIETKAHLRVQERTWFRDQNGDGINDFQQDHDNDGIPNCQDPDWERPEDGTGYKNRNGQHGPQTQMVNRQEFRCGLGLANSSFRHGLKGRGGGICEGTGPHGKGGSKGRR